MSTNVSYPTGLALTIASSIVNVVLDDKSWKPFGFKGKPRRGSFIERFVDSKQLAKERFLRRELMLPDLSLYARALFGSIEKDYVVAIVASILENIIDGGGVTQEPLYPSFGFSCSEEARRYFVDGVIAYAASPLEEYHVVFIERARNELPKLDGGDLIAWMSISASLYSSADTVYKTMLQAWKKRIAECPLEGSVELNDKEYVALAESIINSIKNERLMITEQEAAMRFVQYVAERVRNGWPSVCENLNESFGGKLAFEDPEEALYNFFLSVIWMEQEFALVLFGREKFLRLDKWVSNYFEDYVAEIWGDAVNYFNGYVYVIRAEITLDEVLSGISERLIADWFASRIEDDKVDRAFNSHIFLAVKTSLGSLFGTWEAIDLEFDIIQPNSDHNE